jgi:hypothetical protein
MFDTNMFLWLALIGGYVVLILIGALGLVVVWKMWTGSIDLTKLVSEQDGTASLSRFQFLIFTFVVATGLLLMVIKKLSGTGTDFSFPGIDPSILGLIGISGASYVVSKGIQKNFEASTQGGDQGGNQGGANPPAPPPAWPNLPPAKPG